MVERIGNDKYGFAKWLCKCDCGNIKKILGISLRSGNTKSCGCSCIEKTIERQTKHNLSKTNTYKSWMAMNQRCNNKNNSGYKYYGGRGIKVCYRWSIKNSNGFQNFFKDMGKRPKGMSIDRIKNNKGYHKKNCRWLTYKEQNRNKRNNHLITYNNKTQCLSAWAEEYNIDPDILGRRICRDKWSIKRALTIFARKRSCY